MRLFGGQGVKAVIADTGFTIMMASVGYELRHVSDPSVMFLLGFGVFEEEEIYVVLAFFLGERYSMVKAISVFPGSTAYRFIEISGF